MVAGYVTSVTVHDVAGCMGEGIPDGESAPVLVHRALDLVGYGRLPHRKFSGKVMAFLKEYTRILTWS